MKFNAKTEKAYFYNLSRGNYNKPGAIQLIVKSFHIKLWKCFKIYLRTLQSTSVTFFREKRNKNKRYLYFDFHRTTFKQGIKFYNNLTRDKVSMIFCFQNCTDLLWEKKVLLIEKHFWNSRLKARNLQNFWDYSNNLSEKWKGSTNFFKRMIFK